MNQKLVTCTDLFSWSEFPLYIFKEVETKNNNNNNNNKKTLNKQSERYAKTSQFSAFNLDLRKLFN